MCHNIKRKKGGGKSTTYLINYYHVSLASVFSFLVYSSKLSWHLHVVSIGINKISL